MRVRPLTVPMRDAWLLAAAAVEAERFAEAGALADQAAMICGWERYRPLGCRHRVELFGCELMPRGWCYVHHAGPWGRCLLMHPDAAPFLTEAWGFAHLARAVSASSGLVRLDGLLNAMLIGAMEAPDAPAF